MVAAQKSGLGEIREEQAGLLASDPFCLVSFCGFKMVFAKCRDVCKELKIHQEEPQSEEQKLLNYFGSYSCDLCPLGV